MIDVVPPALVLVAGALLTGLTRGMVRSGVVLLAPLVALYFVWQVPDGVAVTMQFLGYTIEPVEGSPLRRLFATAFTFMAFAGALFSFRQAKWYELAAAHLYAAGAVGVSFAGDLITLFLYWELMAIFSTVVVWCGEGPRARAAGIRYAVIHLLGGVILKVGIEGMVVHTGSIEIQAIPLDNFDAWMMLIGVLINVAAYPISAWLADAYPASTPTGSVFLSAFTTKTAILALILLFPGTGVLIPIGLVMIFYGIIYALLENDIRRILAYSIVNQVGFMVCAVGIGTELAINGAAAHAFAHIIYKALLFMSAGVVIYRTGHNLASDLGGLYRTMPITTICGIIGALSISSFPLTSGFTTKTMISEAAQNEHLVLVYFLLAAASAGVFLHAGIKFPWLAFFQKDSGLRPKDAPWNMTAAMILMSAACIALGVFPQPLYALLPYPVEYEPYKAAKVVFYLQLLLFSGLAFFLLLPWMQRTRTVALDVDWLWRRVLPVAWNAGARLNTRVRRWLAVKVGRLSRDGSRRLANALAPWGFIGRSWQIGTTALWVALMLTTYVVIYYL
ncbi:MAG: Na(+)/H(+) antiporter subunit D [Pseudomonadales bacterium]